LGDRVDPLAFLGPKFLIGFGQGQEFDQGRRFGLF
jgi:hypothetical protein